MFLINQLEKYYPEDIFRNNTEFVLLEYLQHELLDSLYKHKRSEYLSFIGGTAIRIVYGSSRFSEDLDFDNFGLAFPDFEALAQEAVKDMEQKGFEVEFRNVEKGAYHCYIKFPRLLYENALSGYSDRKVLIRIDATAKDLHVTPQNFILDKFDINRSILVNPPEVILSQKLVALLERKRAKGRDIYDISYLMGAAAPDLEYLTKERGIKSKEELKEKVLEKCDALDLQEMAGEVEQFLLEPEKGKQRILTFPQYIRQEL